MKTTFDRRDDVAYVEFSTADSARQVALDDAAIIDYAADGSVVGVEFISPSENAVPRAPQLPAGPSTRCDGAPGGRAGQRSSGWSAFHGTSAPAPAPVAAGWPALGRRAYDGLWRCDAMGLEATTITWYGHACVEIRTPGGNGRPPASPGA